MKSTTRWVTLAVLIAVGVGGAIVHHKFLRWKRFAVVEPGVLYRSGILKEWQLRQAIEQYGVKTVFSFTYTNNDNEQRVCDELGVKRHFCYLAGNGVGPDDPYLRFLQITQDARNHPILVHCSAGVQRTGGGVALYRIIFQGWDFDRAVEEMIERGNKGKQDQIDQLRRIHDRFAQSRLAGAGYLRSGWKR